MRAKWQEKPLSAISSIINGLWTGKKPPFINVGVIRNTNFTKDCLLDTTDIAYLDVEKSQFEKRKLLNGDIIIEKSGGGPKQPVGRPVLFDVEDGNYSFSNFTSAIRCNKALVNPYYLQKYLYCAYINGVTEGMQSHSTGLRNLKLDEYKEIKIPLPPLPEQKSIVTILDEAFSGIARAKEIAEKNLANVKEIFNTYLKSLFVKPLAQWEFKNLSEISIEFCRGKSRHRPRGDTRILGGSYPLIQTGDIGNSSHWIKSYTQTYNEMGLAQSKLWPRGTVCIAIVGANVGETAILDFDACFPDSVIGIIVDKKKANNEYVEYLLQSYKTFLKECGKGTARDNINMATFENQNFPFPPLEEQKKIVGKLNSLTDLVENLENIYSQKILFLEDLKKSLLHQAFSGKL